MATQIRRTRSESRIMDAASDLFYQHGLRGVGIDQVIATSGISKSTLYAHFRSKDDLVAAYLRATDDSWMRQLQDAAERAGDAPAAQLVGLFDALYEAFDRHGFFGCPFISSAVESGLDSQARAITREHVRRRQAWISDLCAAAGAPDPARLASHLGLLIDGALASGRLEQDRSVVDAAKRAAGDAVDSISRNLKGNS